MAEALAKLKDGFLKDCNTGDTDGSLLTNLLEALTAGAQLNVGQKGRTTHSPLNYTLGGGAAQIVDDHLAGIDAAFGGKADSPHDLGGSQHSADSLANLNSKVDGGNLDFDSAARTPTTHALGGSYHSADTLANLNAKVTGGSLDFDTASRPPSGTAGGALSGSYPNPDLGYDSVSAETQYTCETTDYEVITGMSITPSAGTYLVWFNADVGRTGTDDYGVMALFVDTTINDHSLRATDIALGSYHSMGTQAELTVNGSQAIIAKARVSDVGTDFEIYQRSLMILRVAD